MTKKEKQACVLIGMGIAVGTVYFFAPVLLPAIVSHSVRVGVVKSIAALL